MSLIQLSRKPATSLTKILEIISKIEVLDYLLLSIVFKSDCCLVFFQICLQWKTEFFCFVHVQCRPEKSICLLPWKMLTAKNAWKNKEIYLKI